MTRIANLLFASVVCLIFAMIVFAVATRGVQKTAQVAEKPTGSPPATKSETDLEPPSVSQTFSVSVRRPDGPPLIELSGTDPQGRSGKVACMTCHSVRKPNFDNKTAASLDEFHQGLQFSHGMLTCYACHNPENSDALRLADGTSVLYQDVMTMCSQCHSKQAESFAHGAHGGMNGFWDLSRGPQNKNNCIDCHDPHAPSYPKMIVDFKPHDRFNEPSEEHSKH